MKRLGLNLEGKLTYMGQNIKAKPIGKPKVLWCPNGQEETNQIRFDGYMLDFARSVAESAKSEIPDAYIEGEILNRDNINYTPVQFYKIESSE